ncbi:transcriptional regulator FNR [Ectothiorhodospiraceae bacterium BW-2]|nr:transcriptional regulator FNR [Ectothiorhodospiraceae bacterium BW-2]
MNSESYSMGGRCSACSLQRVCLPAGSPHAAVAEFEKLVEQPTMIESGAELFAQNEPLRAIFTIRSGAVKAVRGGAEEQQIVGFVLPGELLGFHAIHTGRHPFRAVAIEPVYLCRIDFGRLMQLLHQYPTLEQQLLMLISRQLMQEQNTIRSLSLKSADARLAALLIGFSDHYRMRGFSPFDFWLPVSRQEMSSYLSLAVETVSRIFSRFQQQGYLRVKGRRIEALNLTALSAMAGIPMVLEPSRSTGTLG